MNRKTITGILLYLAASTCSHADDWIYTHNGMMYRQTFGPVVELGQDSVVVKHRGEDKKFVIDQDTKFCKDAKPAKRRDLANSEVVTVVTELAGDSDLALTLRNGSIAVVLGVNGADVVDQGCHPDNSILVKKV
jgi:hypothetical protein